MRNFEVKRGAALQITLTATKADGTAFDLTTVSIKGTVRDSRDVLVAQLTADLITGTPGAATITVADTTAWPIGLLKADLWISDGALPAITRTFGINVLPAVTYTLPAEAPYDPVTAS